MDFSNLTEENINQAIQFIEKNKVPPGYKSKTADLVVDGKPYPPKYVLVVAKKIADGSVIDVKDFHTRDAVSFLQEKGYNIVKREKESEMSDEEKFKCLLEYFVAHLEYKQSGIKNTFGYQKYIQPLKDHFTETGNGEKDWGLQEQIEKWNSYSNGSRITITINGMSKIRFASKASFLNWKDTWFNVRAKWDDSDKRVVGFYLTNTPPPFKRVGEEFSLKDLCLYDGKAPNEKLKKLFNDFEKLIGEKSMSEYIKEITKLLLNNHNIILHGAPGTGKTYLAKEIARRMGCPEDEIEFVQFHQSYDYADFVEGLRPIPVQGNNKVDGFMRTDGVFKIFCKNAIEIVDVNNLNVISDTDIENMITWFKENYKGQKMGNDSTSFSVEMTKRSMKVKLLNGSICSIAPKYLKQYLRYGRTDNEQHVTYEPIIGDYIRKNYPEQKSIQKKKIEPKNKNFVFIIDEINRGEMSKIFGELFFSIDPSYRGEKGKIKTQYQNLIDGEDVFFEGFFVPKNVYIIGTMNDIDRSVESMDFAMRRRFAFEEITAEQSMSMFDNPESWKDENDEIVKIPDVVLARLKNRMRNLNVAILEPKLNLGQAYQIGGAYFLKFSKYFKGEEEKAFADLWNYHLKGLLTEYLRGMPKLKDSLDKLEEAYKDVVDHRSNVPQGQPS